MGKNDTRKRVIQFVICIGLLVMIWGAYYLVKHYELNRILDAKEDDFSWVYQVDSVKTENEDFVLEGFAFKLKEDSEKGAFEVVLQDIETGENYFPKMEYSERKDVNDYFFCEYDYTESGFEARIREKKLDLKEKNYEVLLRVSGERLTYRTGTYISKGQLMYTNPLEYEPLVAAGTDLEKIVENGVLRVYRPDCGIYVYQYEGELYWIAEEEYGFVEGDTTMQYQLGTTQVEKLPQHRLGNGWSSDNIGFFFSKHELTEWNTGKYRVTKKSLPTEYSIAKIWTGNFIDGWIWIQNFRPYYRFQNRETQYMNGV